MKFVITCKRCGTDAIAVLDTERPMPEAQLALLVREACPGCLETRGQNIRLREVLEPVDQRLWLAGMALSGILANATLCDRLFDFAATAGQTNDERLAAEACASADAVLAELGRKP